MSGNRGAFYIRAEDVDSSDSFRVPGDRTGFTPDDTKNPSQPSYHVDNERTDISKQYYVHVWNGWDIEVGTVKVKGSRYNDEGMVKGVTDQSKNNLQPGTGTGFESDTGHYFLEVEISGLTMAPANGVLEIVFQHRYR